MTDPSPLAAAYEKWVRDMRSRGQFDVDECDTFTAGWKACAERALSCVTVRFGRDYQNRIGCWKEWHEVSERLVKRGKRFNQFADFIPYAEIRRLLAEPTGEGEGK